MQSNLSDTALSLEFIAGQCGVSASYLVRYFKGCMAVTPMQYVDTLRMDIAKHLLSTTGCTLRQIVGQCGYLDESNFARKFKKLEGVTPMSYRKMHWQG
jgi:AraC-like DNA-binding protein